MSSARAQIPFANILGLRMNPGMKVARALRTLGQPISLHPSLGRAFGTVAGAFLGQLIFWSGKGADPDWLYKSCDEIWEETGIGYYEQRAARKRLVGAGVIAERYDRTTHRLYFRVNEDAFERVMQCLIAGRSRGSMSEVRRGARRCLGRCQKPQPKLVAVDTVPRSSPPPSFDQGLFPDHKHADSSSFGANAPLPPWPITSAPTATCNPGERIVGYLPLAGKTITAAPVSFEFLQRMHEAYPDVVIRLEFKRISAWLMSNPLRRKKPGGIARFVDWWMGEEQEKADRQQLRSKGKPQQGGYRGQQLERQAAAAGGWDEEAKVVKFDTAAV